MSEARWHFIAGRVRAEKPALTVGHRICVVAGELLNSENVSLALVIEHSFSPIATTGRLGTLLDEEQFALGDGPSFEARNSPAPIILGDIHAHRASIRWPIFVKLAAKHGIGGVFAFPLRIGDAYLGVLTVYRVHAGEPTAEQYSDGLILASLATAELVRQEAGVGPESGAGIFEPGLYDQSALQIAAGMVAELLNISIVAALVRIRARAFADDQPVSHIAQQIVRRSLVLEK